MKNKLAKIAAVLTVAGLIGAAPVAYALLGDVHSGNSRSHQSKKNKKFNNQQQRSTSQQGAEDKGIMDELNLTPEQRAQFMEVDTLAKQERAKEVREQLPIKTQALDAMLTEEGLSRADVSDLMDEVSALQKEMLSQRMDRYFAMKEILTPEQFAKMLEIEIPGTNEGSEGGEEKSQGSGQEGSGEENQGSDQFYS